MSDQNDNEEHEDFIVNADFANAVLESLRRRYLIALGWVSASAFLTAFMVTMLLPSTESFDEKLIQSDIIAILSNGGDLRAVKQAYSQRDLLSESIFSTISGGRKESYAINTPLSVVLDDIRVQIFRGKDDFDKEMMTPLDKIIEEYEQTNPFDKLQIGQKDYFENIRVKSSSNYENLSNDLNHIADQLFSQNQLADKYLDEATQSSYISMFAVAMAVLLGGFQIWLVFRPPESAQAEIRDLKAVVEHIPATIQLETRQLIEGWELQQSISEAETSDTPTDVNIHTEDDFAGRFLRGSSIRGCEALLMLVLSKQTSTAFTLEERPGWGSVGNLDYLRAYIVATASFGFVSYDKDAQGRYVVRSINDYIAKNIEPGLKFKVLTAVKSMGDGTPDDIKLKQHLLQRYREIGEFFGVTYDEAGDRVA